MTIDSREVIIPNDIEIKDLFGDLNENIEIIQGELDTSITWNKDRLTITGDKEFVAIGLELLEKLIDMLKLEKNIDRKKIETIIDSLFEKNHVNMKKILDYPIGKTAKGQLIKPKTIGQKRYIESINQNFIVFGIGPAGTGKTYLGIAMAAEALRKKQVDRIILTRPAVEAGEKLGFLPGDLQEKVDPYLRPVYDALYEILGVETCRKYIERGNIEIAPLAYMRGRTLDSSYIILDEAQNATNEQMKMILTRIGKNSRLVVTGDITQTDLSNKDSGLKNIGKILGNIKGIGFSYLNKKDIVRHHIVQKIIEAYERYEEINE